MSPLVNVMTMIEISIVVIIAVIVMVLKPNAIMVLVSTIMMNDKATLGTPVHRSRVIGHGSGGDCCEDCKKQTKRYEIDIDHTLRF
jgi:hypothetical protein